MCVCRRITVEDYAPLQIASSRSLVGDERPLSTKVRREAAVAGFFQKQPLGFVDALG